MLKHNLPQFVSHAASVGRYLLIYCHAARQAMVVALSRIGSPRDAFRIALQERKFSLAGVPGQNRKNRPLVPLLFHYHIFKNAGTSFEWALKRALRSGLRRLDTPYHDGFISQRDIRDYVHANAKVKVVISHQAAPPAPEIEGRRVLTSILIRDPIARIRSIYEFERSQPSDGPGPAKAKEVDFKSYVEWRLAVSPRMFCNFQVHFCQRTGRKNDPTPNRFDLHKAIAALDAIDIVGTVERYKEWLALTQSILAENFGGLTLTSVRRNQSAGEAPKSEAEILDALVKELGPALVQKLLEENELDMRLHQVADALLTRRLAERSVLIRLRDAYGRAHAAGGAAPEV